MSDQGCDPIELKARMVTRLTANTYLGRWAAALTPWWSALATVPRHKFIPGTVWVKNPRYVPALLPLHRDKDPQRWLELAYGDDAVITQIDDGSPRGPGLAGVMPTSSASSPVMVAVMLAALDAQPGHHVLEIGTGTGYNAALLGSRLGAEQVNSIEIDPEVAAQARQALSATGYGAVGVITGEGAHGHPPRSPYDRVIATAAVQHIPYPWVAQTRPGGRILLPWANTYTEALVALTVDEHGTATGTIAGESAFMCLRAQRQRRGSVGALVGEDEDRVPAVPTDLHPYCVSGDVGARFAIGQRVPRCQWRYWPYDDHDGVGVLWLLDFESRSWAKLTHRTPDASDDEFGVCQYGSRRLWDEVATAYHWWTEHGKPGPDRWQFVVTPEGQRIQLA